MNNLRRWLGLWALLLVVVVSCGGDRAMEGSGGAGVEAVHSPAALPASLRLVALRAMQEAPGHDFASKGETLVARIGAHGEEAWAEIGREGVEVTPLDGGFALGVRTVHVGRQATSKAVSRVVSVRGEGQEAVLVREGVEERYLAGPLGLEQTYRIEARPAGGGPLTIGVAFEGLAPDVVAGAESVIALKDELGATRAVYRDLAAVDAEGRDLAARMEVTDGGVTLVIDDERAVYPVVVDPLVVTQQAKLLAGDGVAGEYFGRSVSVSGDTALVGAIAVNGYRGAVYVFVRSGTLWSQQAKLVASDSFAYDQFGWSVSLSGDTAVIGAPYNASSAGAAYVFVRNGTSWSQQQKLLAGDRAALDDFGISVSVSVDTALVGAHRKDNSTGAAYVFVRSGASWAQQQKLFAGDGAANDNFGVSVSLSGNTALVGAPYKDSATGAAYVFVRSGASWAQQQKLFASDGAANDNFGISVSMSGETALIGAPYKDSGTGAAYAFVRSGASWAQQQKLFAGDGAANDNFGISVSVSGETALVGGHNQAGATGAAYLFARSGASWSQQQKVRAGDATAGSSFAYSVSLSGSTALVGVYATGSSSGAAYVFVDSGAGWIQQEKLLANDGAQFGISVSVSGDTAIVGASVKASYTGAAYVFVRSGTSWAQQQKLVATDGVSGDCFGASVGVSGDTALVGAYCKASNTGAAYIFVRSGTSWSQQAKLLAGDGALYDNFGSSVSVSGDTALVGAPYKGSDAGAAYVFVRSGTSWSQQQKLLAGDGAANDMFGTSVSVSGDTALVGAIHKSNAAGAAYVFLRSGASWAQQQKLLAGDAASFDNFGFSVSVSGDTALVGATGKDNGVGAAYVFLRSGTSWSQQQKLSPGNGAASDSFGRSVSVSGDMAVVGAPYRTGTSGAAHVFLRSGASWSQQAKLLPGDGLANDGFGVSASVWGSTAVVGAPVKASYTGAAYVFWIGKQALGGACGSAAECASGFCADGVCCNTACDAGACDACSVATGAAVDGTCALLTGTPCDDGSACTQTDTCQAGACVGGDPVVCPAPDQCHVAGTCIDPASGACSNPTKPDGTACDDGNASTVGDVCMAGACAGVDHCIGVICIAPDQCHVAGTCIDHATGACSNPAKADGTVCDDGNANTVGDVCAAGVCAGVDHCVGVVCTAQDQCHVAGACDHATGACSNPAKPDGSACDDGDACTQTDTCQGGACVGASPIVCSAPDQCHDAGTCDPTMGTCDSPAKPDGTTCDDGNASTVDDVCTVGVCAGVDHCIGVVCTAQDQCHVAGACDHATGMCDSPAKADGSACDDGDACTQTDACQSGACVGASPLSCAAQDECHEVGVCDPATGACDSPAKLDGTACSTGTCVAGVCTSSSSSSSSSTSSSSTSSSSGTGGSGGGSTSSSSTSSSGETGGSGGSTSSSSSTSSTSTSSTSSSGGDPGGGAGCGCRAAGDEDTPGAAWLGAAGVALALVRRRRSHPAERR